MMFSQKKTTNRIWPRALIVQLVSSLVVFVSTGELNFSSMYLCCGLTSTTRTQIELKNMSSKFVGVFFGICREMTDHFIRVASGQTDPLTYYPTTTTSLLLTLREARGNELTTAIINPERKKKNDKREEFIRYLHYFLNHSQ